MRNFDLIRRVKSLELSKKQIRRLKRIASEVLVAVAIMTLAPLAASGQIEIVQASENLQIDTNAIELVTLTNKQINIVPGESKHDKTVREAREAEEAAKRSHATQASRRITTSAAPANLVAIYKAAGARFGVPWQLLSAVHLVETGRSGNTGRCSYAGACGPMQFIPSTWRAYGVDGNGDGVRDITNLVDAIYGAANYLGANGANRGDYVHALYRYNHSTAYVNKVLGIARGLGL